MHTRWPKFYNIHRMVADVEFDEHEQVVVLEKLDGSNLGIEVHPQKSLIALHGRNSILWQKDESEDDPFSRQYGSVRGNLRPLANIIPKLTKLAEEVLRHEGRNSTDTIIFYGEWFAQDAAVSSWHPFGYGFRLNVDGQQKNSFRTMTSQRHKMFLDYDLHPPRLLFSGGNLCDAINALFPLMTDPPERFEGIFISSEKGGTRNCAKWKTAAFEEQVTFVIPESMPLSLHMQEAVSKLKTVFAAKSASTRSRKQKSGTKSKEQKPATDEEKEADHQIFLALSSVLSKSPLTVEEIRSLDRARLVHEMKRINAETLEDICETYAETGNEVPKLVRKRLGKFVAAFLFRRNATEEEGKLKE